MTEKNQPLHEQPAGAGGGLGSIFGDELGGDGLVTVASGPYAEQLPVVNLTVGEIRARFRDRFDIDPRSQAVLAGNEVGDQTVVRHGQLLMFVRRAGEKGMCLCIEGTDAIAMSPEGQTARLSVETLLARIAPPRMDTCGVILPDGVKIILSEGPVTIWIYESPPRVHNFQWIADDSPTPFGKGTKYRQVRIALPYLVVLAVFGPSPNGQMQLTCANECFFRTAPLKSLDDELLFPALLNCSKFVPEDGHPLSWICTQHLNLAAVAREPDLPKRLSASFNALRHCLLETGFNYSSENHEASSWFTASRGVDPRVSTVDAWQAASAQDPLFVLDVSWLKTGRTLRQVAERTFGSVGGRRSRYTTAAALARVIFNQTAPPHPRHQILHDMLHELAQ